MNGYETSQGKLKKFKMYYNTDTFNSLIFVLGALVSPMRTIENSTPYKTLPPPKNVCRRP